MSLDTLNNPQEKRHKLDNIMLNIESTPATKIKDTYETAGALMADLGLIDEQHSKNIPVIIAAYKQHTLSRLRHAAKRKGR